MSKSACSTFSRHFESKKIAEELLISQDDFKVSQQLLLHGEGGEMDRENPDLVAALDKLYAIISKYDLENIYNMDKIGLFFRLLPKYTLLMPYVAAHILRMLAAHERKKAKERVSLVVCAKDCHLQFVQMPQERTKSHAH